MSKKVTESEMREEVINMINKYPMVNCDIEYKRDENARHIITGFRITIDIINTPTLPIPESVTDTEQPINTLTAEEAMRNWEWCSKCQSYYLKTQEHEHNCGAIWQASYEPTNADILAAIRDLKECMRQLQQGERIGL